MKPAPIVLFTYARPDHIRATIEALLKNPLSAASDLTIYSDSARTTNEQNAVAIVRSYLDTISGFRSITIHRRPQNFGLSRNIIEGITEMLSVHDSVIVLEDDMLTSPHFLQYMNDALVRFAKDTRVASVHGYVYPVNQTLPEAFFLRGADCWGWATWRRAWSCFNPNGEELLRQLRRRRLLGEFDLEGAFPFSQMLESQIKGDNDSWAIRWHASAFLADKLTLYPGRSLINNIGNDSSGTHCGSTNHYNATLSSTPIVLENLEVSPSKEARSAFKQFLGRRRRRSGVLRAIKRLLRLSKGFSRMHA